MFSKSAVEDHRQLCIFSLYRNDALRERGQIYWIWRDSDTGKETARIGLQFLGHALRLNYRARWGMGEWEAVCDTIFLSKTRPAKGGARWWLVCPTCSSRRAKLYLNTYFRCRECLGLCYSSQLETKSDRDLRRFYGRRQNLGGFGGTLEPFPPKPKWMRWATYERLCAKDCHDLASIAGNAKALLERLR